MIRSRRFGLPRASLFVTAIGLAALLLGGCNTVQYDPSGQNSGSPQNSQGTFNLDTTGTNAINGSVNQPLNVYDSFTSVTTTLTITSATASTQPANQNANTVTLENGMQYLVVNLTITNTSANATGCPNAKADGCMEYITPLSNFRLFDSQGRMWNQTTGASETCSADPHTTCASRDWLNEATSGIAPGQTFTGTMAFYIPTNENSFSLYFAPYRFGDANPQLSGGNASSSPLPTLAVITITD